MPNVAHRPINLGGTGGNSILVRLRGAVIGHNNFKATIILRRQGA